MGGLLKILKNFYLEFSDKWENYFFDLRTAIKDENWSLSLADLLWGAGPICFVSLSIGHYIAYTRFPDTRLLIYFSLYAFGTELFSILTRIAMYSSRKSQANIRKNQFIVSIEKLLATMNRIKSITHDHLGPNEKICQESAMILENPDAEKDEIQFAIYNLTRSQDLTRIVLKVEIYRKYGLYQKIRQTNSLIQDDLIFWENKLKIYSSTLAENFVNRFRGVLPSKKTGIPRKEGFLGRFHISQNIRNYDLVHIEDAFEVYKLVYELLIGRKIPYFTCKFQNVENLIEISADLERNFQSYKSLLSMRKKILDQLRYEIGKDESAHCTSIILHDEIKDFLKRTKTKIQKDKLSLIVQEEKIQKVSTLYVKFLEFCERIELKKINLKSSHKKYGLAQKTYFTNYSNVLRNLDSLPEFKIKMSSKKIEISQKEKIRLIEYIYRLFRTFNIDEETKLLTIKNKNLAKELKKKANDLLSILEDFIPFHQVDTQIAIETSRGCALSSLDPHLTFKTLFQWSEALVEEIQEDVPNMIYRVAQWIVSFRKEKLSASEIQYLKEKFLADEEMLEGIEAQDQMEITRILKNSNNFEFTETLDQEIKDVEDQIQILIRKQLNLKEST